MARNKVYTLGARRALEKLGLLDQSMRNYYPGLARTSPMVGEAAVGEYDPMELLKRMGRVDEGFTPMDRNMQDSGVADTIGTPITDGSDP